jgi:hypothetical protein
MVGNGGSAEPQFDVKRKTGNLSHCSVGAECFKFKDLERDQMHTARIAMSPIEDIAPMGTPPCTNPQVATTPLIG